MNKRKNCCPCYRFCLKISLQSSQKRKQTEATEMKRSIITIDEEKCTGCGQCAAACHEGAIQMVDGKAKLMSESYCDGLGACLPSCPANAIRIDEREAAAFDEKAVAQHLAKTHKPDPERKETEAGHIAPDKLACGCPGTHARSLEHKEKIEKACEAAPAGDTASELRQWPCQIQLVPPNAPYLQNAHLLIAADCTAYANANVHGKWMKGRITLIGCPKLDDVDYAEKLEEILRRNEIKSLTILRMSVPCCGGIVQAAKRAMQNAGTMIPWQVVTIDTNGDILSNEL
jgi:Pyruvate/2-oxoacid:ferredoxin oxidoreductase delta subunit